MKTNYNDPEKVERRNKFEKLVERVRPLPLCKFCGRCVMIGMCCEGMRKSLRNKNENV